MALKSWYGTVRPMPSAIDVNSAKNNSKGWENIEGSEDGQEEGSYNLGGKKGKMKKQRRKHFSVERRDIWDNSKIYEFAHLSVDRLKHKLKHIPKKDRKMRSRLEEALRWRRR